MAAEPPRYPLVVVDTTPDEADALVGRLTLLGADGIEERDATTLSKPGIAGGVTLVASFPTRELADAAARELGGSARVEELVGDAWRDAWREHWKPTRLGQRIVVVPSWIEYEPSSGDLVLRLDPGRAFGTGQHASTALVAEQLEHMVVAGTSDPILDVGCGSGILSFIALALGVPRAIACDVDAEAIAATRENAEQLGFADRVDARVGGIDVIPETSTLVVANIEAAVLIPMAPALASRVAPGGTLVLSGILAEQAERVREAYEAAGLVAAEQTRREGWVAPRFTRGAR